MFERIPLWLQAESKNEKEMLVLENFSTFQSLFYFYWTEIILKCKKEKGNERPSASVIHYVLHLMIKAI